MSTCEACGGDGQIEAGAYRGDDSPDTRECRLCGGVAKVVVNIPETTSIDRTVEILNELGQAAAKTGRVMSEVSFRDERGRVRTVHEIRTDGDSLKPESVVETRLGKFERLGAGVTTFHNGPPQTPQDVAREYAARLNAENERQQREAESKLATNPTDAAMNKFLRDQWRDS